MTTFQNAKLIGQNVSSARYLAQESKRGELGFVMSRSELSEFAICPHRWKAGFRDVGSKSTEWGELADCLLFSPDDFQTRFAVVPEQFIDEYGKIRQTKEYKEWRLSAGQVRVKPQEASMAERAIELIRNDYDASCLLEDAKTQVFVAGEYHDPETGLIILCKALLDIVPSVKSPTFGKSLCDFKTVADASADNWSKTVYRWGWHEQAAFHADLYVAATGEDRVDWLHLVQENFEPFEIGKRHLTTEFLNLGRHSYLDKLRKYAWCLKNDQWPTYDEIRPNSALAGWSLIGPELWMEEQAKRHMRELRPIETPLHPTKFGMPGELQEVTP